MRTYSLLCRLIAPDKVTDFTFEQLVESQGASKSVYVCDNSMIPIHISSTAKRGINCFVRSWVTEPAEYCEFGNMLEDMLQDRLVSRIEDTQIQQCLCRE